MRTKRTVKVCYTPNRRSLAMYPMVLPDLLCPDWVCNRPGGLSLPLRCRRRQGCLDRRVDERVTMQVEYCRPSLL